MALKINNLAPYIPGLKGFTQKRLVEIMGYDLTKEIKLIWVALESDMTGIANVAKDRYSAGFTPILFSLDNLTKPITINGETFVPMEKLRKMYPNTPNFEYIVGLTHVSNFYFKEGLTNTNIEYCVVQKLFEWKFAINLPEGSWLPVSETLNPYK